MSTFQPTRRVLKSIVSNERIMVEILLDAGVTTEERHHLEKVHGNLEELESQIDPVESNAKARRPDIAEVVHRVKLALRKSLQARRQPQKRVSKSAIATKLTVLFAQQQGLLECLEAEPDLRALTSRCDDDLLRWLERPFAANQAA